MDLFHFTLGMLVIVGKDLSEFAFKDYQSLIFGLIGGLGVFLFGMKLMSEGLQAVAGSSLRQLINAVTGNRFKAVGAGAAMTCLIQSSSVTTVMTVGFVNSGFMKLRQAIGVIMGANIGTTITAWLAVLALLDVMSKGQFKISVADYGLPAIGIAAFFYLFARRDRTRYLAMCVIGIGMVFFGLVLMKNGLKPISKTHEFQQWFHSFQVSGYGGVILCAALGCLLTLVVQSSSATIGLTMAAATTGAISFETAAAFILGENLGTTITALLASIGTTTNARRAAVAHMMFNLLGIGLFLPFFFVVASLITRLYGIDAPALVLASQPGATQPGVVINQQIVSGILLGMATIHSSFNIINTLIFIPFVGTFDRFLHWLIRDKDHKEVPHLTDLEAAMGESRVLAVEQARHQVAKMGEGVGKMMVWVHQIIHGAKEDEQLIKKVFRREEVLDNVEREVTRFITDMLHGEVSHEVAEDGRELMRIADEYESASDGLVHLLKAYLRIRHDGFELNQEQYAALDAMHQVLLPYLQIVQDATAHARRDFFADAHSEAASITHRFKELRREYLASLTNNRIDPVVSINFMAMLNMYRRVKEHSLNIAETLCGRS